MDLLERAWDGVGNFMGSLMHGFERGVTSVFGTSNARYIKKLQAKVEAINALEPTTQAMPAAELRRHPGREDARRHTASIFKCSRRQGCACRHGQRLPRSP